jgi:hypothetical protein
VCGRGGSIWVKRPDGKWEVWSVSDVRSGCLSSVHAITKRLGFDTKDDCVSTTVASIVHRPNALPRYCILFAEKDQNPKRHARTNKTKQLLTICSLGPFLHFPSLTRRSSASPPDCPHSYSPYKSNTHSSPFPSQSLQHPHSSS